MKADKRKDTWYWFIRILAVGFIAFMIFQLFLTIRNDRILQNSYETTVGSLTKYAGGGSSYSITYTFDVNNKQITGHQLIYKNYFPGCYYLGTCLGRKFEVRYNPQDPDINRIYLDKPVDSE